jgi:hypothetical protein
MTTLYFTFGQSHIHKVNQIVWDKDCVCSISAGTEAEARKIMFDTFGLKWSMEYFSPPEMEFFPRGIIPLDKHALCPACGSSDLHTHYHEEVRGYGAGPNFTICADCNHRFNYD